MIASATVELFVLIMDALAGARLGRAIPILREVAADLPSRTRVAAVTAVLTNSRGYDDVADGGLHSLTACVGPAMHHSLTTNRRAGEKGRSVVAVVFECRFPSVSVVDYVVSVHLIVVVQTVVVQTLLLQSVL